MGFFAKNDPLTLQLIALEEKRAAFAARMNSEGFAPLRTVYATRDGGFTGLADMGGRIALIYGPGPAEDKDFSVTYLEKSGLNASLSDEYVKPTGMGGAFGFGTKPMGGFVISLTAPGAEPVRFSVMGNRDCCLETVAGRDRLFSEKQHKNGWNFAWLLNPVTPREAAALGKKWLKIICEQ